MDKIRKTRTVVRTAFSKTLATLLQESRNERPDIDKIQALFAIFKDKTSELEDLNEKMFQQMQEEDTPEADMLKEIESADEYRIKYQQTKVSIARIIDPPPIANVEVHAGTSNNNSNAVTTHRNSTQDKRYKLPKIELQKFSGDIKEWLLFWNLFKNIHDDRYISKEDKFQYLIQAMVKDSRAYELVNSYPPTAENYDKVIKSLKSRFGRDELLIEVYIRELLKLVLNNTTKKESKPSIVNLYDKLETQLRALESLNVTTEMCAAMLYPLVESSLPEELLRVWQRHPSSTSVGENVAKDRLTKLMSFLQMEVEAEERIAMAVSGFGMNTTRDSKERRGKNSKPESSETPTAAGLLNARETRTTKCIFCNENHDSSLCDKARKMSIEERTEVVKSKRACFNCLKIGHSCKYCKYKEKCAWCGGKHVILMCRKVSKETPKSLDNTDKKTEEQSLTNLSLNPRIFLQTLRVKLYNGSKEQTVRAVLDTGSHRSYITSQVAKRFGFEQLGKQSMIHLLFGGNKTEPQDHLCYRIHVRGLNNTFSCNFIAFSQDTICQNIQQIIEGPWQEELRHESIELTDIGQEKQPISLLIGADILGKLYTGKIVNLNCGLTAIETKLGWTLLGKMHNEQPQDTALVVSSMFSQDASIADMWKLDVIGIEDPIQKLSKEEHQREILQNFRETTKLDHTGRYEVVLPWKENHPPLSDNRDIAERRLENTQKKLKENNLIQEYEKIFDEWLNEGIIEEVPIKELDEPGFYLPHRPIIKNNSTTRIRPVFDASVKGTNRPSLNQCLETGPNFIELIPSLLLRFRENQIGITADIRKAFLQISVAPKERNVLRFLWKKTQDLDHVIVYRHCRVIFGATSSPFLLGATIDLHLEHILENTEDDKERKILNKLKESFYVDNCVSSVDSEEEAVTFQERTTFIMASGGFDLRGWRRSYDEEDNRTIQVLGLTWDIQEDTLRISPSTLLQTHPYKVTKREILSYTQKIFDPIGIACPVMVKPKILLKKLWSNNVDWDTEAEDDIKKTFLQWQQELKLLCQVRISRWALGNRQNIVSLHLFTDASQEAYGAVIFARVQSESKVDVHFIEAKSRIAPKEKATIPRLELLGASIGARLINRVRTALNNQHIEQYYWTDSSTVLAWIQRDTRWATFVWNRVQEIRQLTNPTRWQHVPGDMNPADLPSRGCNAKQLLETHWWEGPQWLKLPKEMWPNSQPIINEDLVAQETKKTINKETKLNENTITTTMSNLSQNQEEQRLTNRLLFLSNYLQIIRTLAWIRRFIGNSQLKSELRSKTALTAKEIQLAETTLLRLVQEESFSKEHRSKWRAMNIYKDESGLLRTKSLISNKQDTLDFRHPIILDAHHPIVVKLIEYVHRKLRHAHIDIVMNHLREQYWIFKSRRAVSSITRKCTICRRYNAKNIESSPAALPENRVRDAAVFEITGIDFAGPLFLRDKTKAWICLFTCAVYRAIHLELVSSLSTELFLEAFRRFIARRGRPSTVYTDNGTNFVGASRSLQEINWSKIEEYSSTEKIQWIFNPPSAAWWGGWWERLIRSIKELLRKILRRACLNYEELTTILCDCEAIINSRPITYLAEDPQQLIPLSPALFLQDTRSSGVPDMDIIASTEKLNRRIKYRQELRDQLRQRFRIEYLGQLSRKNRPKSNTETDIKIGDIVFIGNDQTKRLDWPLGKVIQLFPGRDDKVRVVKLKTTTGELVRPIQRLYPLELSSNEEEISEEYLKQYKRSADTSKSQHRKDTDTDETPERREDEETERRSRSGRKLNTPKRLL